jgi:GR25 family glycosyltransferase involved in LPS biosynthesis
MQDTIHEDERFRWLAERCEWIEESNDLCFDFGPVIVLCLDERLDHINRFLDINGIRGHVSILRAFRPESLDLDELADLGLIQKENPDGVGQPLSHREICCALGHIAMYLKSERSEHEVTVLLEDDLVIKNQYEDITTLMGSATAFPWDMLYLSFAYADRKNAVQISEELLRIPGSLTTNAYAIRESARRNILESCFPIRKAADIFLRDLSVQRSLEVLASLTPCFDQDRSFFESSIEANRAISPPRWKPTLPQKILSRAFSLAQGTGGLGYDEGIYRIDRFRSGEIPEAGKSSPLLRSWSILARLFSDGSL